MATIKQFTSTQTITEPLVQAGPGLIPKEVSGLGTLGADITKLGQKFKKVEDNRDVAEGIANYNNLINTYNETLPTKDPSEYVSGFNALQGNISKLTEGMSAEAANVLRNKTVIWNEVNRASLATLAIKQTAAFAKQEMPIQLASFVANDQIQEGEDFINAYGETVLSPKEVTLWQDKFKSMQKEWNMEELINVAIETGAQGDITTAEKAIKKFYRTDQFEADPRAEFSALSRLRGGVGSKRSELTEARKALLNKESETIAGLAVENKPFQGNVTPENQDLADRINNRIANNSMDVSDGITFDSMQEQVLSGKNFSERELMEGLSGTDEEGGMSRTEYTQLASMNKQTAKLDIQQKERLSIFMAEMNRQYIELNNAVKTKVQFNQQPRIAGAVTKDRIELKNQVVRMLRDGSSDEEISRAIQVNFIADSSKYTRNWFGRVFNYGIRNFTDITRDTADREDQNQIMLDILKDNPNTDNIDDLFELFIE